MKLTVGISTLGEMEGVWWTLNILCEYHTSVMREAQVVIVCQDPDSWHGKHLGKFVVQKLKHKVSHVKFDSYRKEIGIGPGRNRANELADGDYVLVLDGHVYLRQNALKYLMKYHRQNDGHSNLIVGPCISEDGQDLRTHQELVWRAQALGVWNLERVNESFFLQKPFEVPTQGLGLYSYRREEFPGFHPGQSGFGSAEAIFCQKWRDRGGAVLCHPALAWTHRFFREENKVPYEVLAADKVSNYLIEMLSEGIDVSGLMKHFGKQLNETDLIYIEEKLQSIGLLNKLNSQLEGGIRYVELEGETVDEVTRNGRKNTESPGGTVASKAV